MYPAQTSFIPIQIALARFLESHGWQAIFQNYPYWYLGTTPFRYLTGPILPLVLTGLHRFLPFLSLFEIFFLLLGLVWPVGSAGVYLLVRKLGGEKLTAIFSALFFFFGPLMPLLFRFSNGLSLISFSFLPFVLLVYVDFLESIKLAEKGQTRSRKILLGLLVLILLLDISIFSRLFLGLAVVFLTIMGWKKVEKGIKESLLLIAYCLLLVTIWYLPGYWRQIIMAPSFAGKPLYQVVSQLGQLLPITMAVVLASFSGRFVKLKSRVLKFAFYWLFIFGFLTLIRFISDPDFWLDWSNYTMEIQLGIAIVLAWLAERKLGRLGLFGVMAVYLSLFGYLFPRYVLGTLQKDIAKSVEYQVGQELAKVVRPGEKVFLSGSTSFWLNAFFDITQVRGGDDGPSVDRQWRTAAWEIREGTDPEKSLNWLKDLNLSYLVIHAPKSQEYYHDFLYPEKFEKLTNLKKIYDKEGDKIYQLLK